MISKKNTDSMKVILSALSRLIYFCLITVYLASTSTHLIAQGQLVFRSDRSGDPRLYMMEPDGTNLRMLEAGDPLDAHADTSASYAAARPRWSPDGQRIVFYTYWGKAKGRTNGQDIVIINADGTNRKRLTSVGYNTDPSWSPDGRQIIFRALKDQNWGLYILEVETGEIRLLIDTPYMDRAPSWSPDGKRIIFSSGYGSDRPSQEDIFMVNINGEGLVQLTNGPGEESLPIWSPNGQYIIYNVGTDTTAYLMQMKADGTNKQSITLAGINYGATFSSDGSHLVFNSSKERGTDVYSMNRVDRAIKQLTNHPARDNGGSWFIPSKHEKIVYCSSKDGNDEIYMMNIDGSEQINLTNNPAEDRRPWWSPDGTQIYFETNRNGNWDIYRMYANGSNPEPILISEEDEKYPGLSFDGKQLAVLRSQDGQLGLYTFNIDGSGLTELTQFGIDTYDSYPTWSPDGEMLCFASNRDTKIRPTTKGENGLEIYTMTSRGREVQRLTFNEEEDSLPVFSPDGSHLLFNSSRTGNYHLYTMEPDGREVTPLTWGDHDNWSARYSKDGMRIVFVSNRAGGANIFMMDLESKQVRQLTFDQKSKSPALIKR